MEFKSARINVLHISVEVITISVSIRDNTNLFASLATILQIKSPVPKFQAPWRLKWSQLGGLIQKLSMRETNCPIQWIEIYPVDRAILRWNNWARVKLLDHVQPIPLPSTCSYMYHQEVLVIQYLDLNPTLAWMTMQKWCQSHVQQYFTLEASPNIHIQILHSDFHVPECDKRSTK